MARNAQLTLCELVQHGSLQLQDKWTGEVVELSWEPRAFLFKKFLSDEECDHIIAKVNLQHKLFTTLFKHCILLFLCYSAVCMPVCPCAAAMTYGYLESCACM